MKLTIGVADFSEETLSFAQQYGVSCLKVNAGDFMDQHRRGPVQADKLARAQERVAAYRLKIGVALLPQQRESQHWNIRLGRSGREREMADVCRSVEILGREGIPVVEYVFNLAAVWGSETLPTGRGQATVRNFDYAKVEDVDWEPEFQATEDEVWDRIGYFLKHVIPVAESSEVKMACHPDDPPVAGLKGETRVLGSMQGLQRLLEMAPSGANGLNFCQGTVAEAGIDVLEAIRYFGSRQKIHHVHFRNVKGSLPAFQESFIDDGDVDMWRAMRAFKEVGYTGTIMPDHVPQGTGGSPWIGRAYALGYMRAMMKELEVLEE